MNVVKKLIVGFSLLSCFDVHAASGISYEFLNDAQAKALVLAGDFSTAPSARAIKQIEFKLNIVDLTTPNPSVRQEKTAAWLKGYLDVLSVNVARKHSWKHRLHIKCLATAPTFTSATCTAPLIPGLNKIIATRFVLPRKLTILEPVSGPLKRKGCTMTDQFISLTKGFDLIEGVSTFTCKKP